MKSAALLVSAAAALTHTATAASFSPSEYVNTLVGTKSRYDFSHGNILPVVSTPWGFNNWSPYTNNGEGSWFFHPDDRRFFGMRLTHQPSPWISDYGQLNVMALITDPSHYDSWQYGTYNPMAPTTTFKPYLFNTSLVSFASGSGGAMTFATTSTSHGAVIAVTFPPYVNGEVNSGFNQTRRIIVSVYCASNDALHVDPGTGSTAVDGLPTITGYTTCNSGGVPYNFAHYFTLTVTADEAPNGRIPVLATGVMNDSSVASAYIDFDPTVAGSNAFTIRVATSLISQAQSLTTYNAEVAGQSFEAVMTASKAQWDSLLSRMKVVDVGTGYSAQESHDMQVTLYSNMYRAMLFPRQLSETTENGTLVHWSPFDLFGRVYPGPLSTDQGFWDSYRTVAPFLSVVFPDILGTMIQGWVNGYLEGGWLPKWASPGYRGSMVGTMGDVSLAAAITLNISGFDVEAAYAAIRKDAFELPPLGAGEGRTCLQPYLQYGYVPNGAIGANGECSEVVSRSQNYWLADFAIANAAAALGKTEDAEILFARAANYTKLFDPSTGFFRSRSSADPSLPFTEPFDQFAWGGDYTEAGPWQYRFYVPHDPRGLAKLYKAAGLDMCEMLAASQTAPPVFHTGAYGSIIHEQAEMVLNVWGQYEHNNQPVHHILPTFAALDDSVSGPCAAQGQYWLRQAVTKLYGPGYDGTGFCGDEDNGEFAAWYLLGVMGIYSLAPSTPEYVLGSPLFAALEVAVPGAAAPLTILGLNNSKANVYVHNATWNGAPVSGTAVNYFDLMQGGTLAFQMSAAPAAGSKKL